MDGVSCFPLSDVRLMTSSLYWAFVCFVCFDMLRSNIARIFSREVASHLR